VAAAAGTIVVLRRDWRRGLLLLVFPAFLFLFLGAQARFFGRWLLPVYPMLCVLAGCGVVAAARALGGRSRRAALVAAGLTALLCVQGVLASVHSARVLGREDTRAQARAWLDANVPDGARVAVEPFVPAGWLDAPYAGARRFVAYPVPRPFQAYERRLRDRRIERYRRGGYCWVVVGSHQKGRGLKAGLANARAYYRALDAATAAKVTFSPFAPGADPVPFSLRLLLQLSAPGVRAAGARGRHPPAARMHAATGMSQLRWSPRAGWALIAVGAVVALIVFVARPTYPNYDTYYTLVWGQELARGSLPDYDVFRTPTPHPLSTLVAWALAPFGTASDRLLVLASLLGYVGFLAVAYLFTLRLLGR
jgi:hypothetical protein